jgi:origin recognition complex subunit 2
MEEWFQKATPENVDVMSALQLEYRFKGDNLSGKWWQKLQEVGFKYDKDSGSYKSGEETPRIFQGSNELFDYLDQFAIPSLTSTLQDPPTDISMSKKEESRGRKLRDELIFRKFVGGLAVTNPRGSSQHKNQKANITTKKRPGAMQPRSRKSKTRRSMASSEPGADLFFRKPKAGTKKSLLDENIGDEEVPLVFPTIKEYAAAMQTYELPEVIKIETSYKEHFQEWRFLVSTNHSLLFYGLGSKRTLLNQFANEELKRDGDLLVIDGFDKEVTIEGILDLLIDYWLDGVEPKQIFPYAIRKLASENNKFPRVGITFPHRGEHVVVQKAIAIAHALAQKASKTLRPLFVVLHNIDGVGLRNKTAQEALAGLVLNSSLTNGMNSLRLVASVDHVNAPALLWDSLTSASFGWMWEKINTYRPYIEEITESKIAESQTKSIKHKRDRESAVGDSIITVLTSLAPRCTDCLQQLAQLQFRAAKGEEFVDYTVLMKQIQDKCIVNSDVQLRQIFKELVDQDIVEMREINSVPSYRIPYSTQKLKEILEYQR